MRFRPFQCAPAFAFTAAFSALPALLLLSALTASPAHAGFGQAPAGWDDMRIGLVNDGKDVYNDRMKAALADGIRLDYRYVYVNNGAQAKADTARNAYSWLFSEWADYSRDSEAMGLRPAYVIYMLQEDLSPPEATLAANANDPVFMRNFFTTLKRVAERSKGQQAVFVLEPDTWGYVMQAGIDPLASKAFIKGLGGDFAFLSDLPDDYSGLARGMIRAVKRFAPDAHAGILMSHWTPTAYQCPSPDIPNSAFGMPWRSAGDIDCSADRNVEFANRLLGKPDWVGTTAPSDRGDFIGVEKNGHSAGYWYAYEGKGDGAPRRFYWDDAQNANWLRWSKRLGQGVDLPVLGWQISIGSAGLSNTCLPGPVSQTPGLLVETGNCAFEDTFFPYFFRNVPAFVDAGFIGFLAGKGLGMDTDFTHVNKDSGMGDKGWFLGKLKEFDKGRPYLKQPAGVKPMPGAGEIGTANAAGVAMILGRGNRDVTGRLRRAGQQAYRMFFGIP